MSKPALVWDLPLRVFHWLFAGTVIASWYTSDQDHDLIELHIQLGYFALGLIIFRLLWGVVGTKHARFISFVPKPKQLHHYIKNLKQNRAPASIGHNPLGSLMVILMIMLISLQAISGLFINDDIYSSGPYNAIVTKDIEQVMAFLHHHVFDYMIGAIALHLLAIFYYVRIKKETLIVPMITGRKPAKHINDSDVIKHSKLWLAAFIIIMVTVFVYWLVVLNVPIVEEYY
ncbi:MAG: cytochrome b/b6 domain-containing protein [Colwellia sp.]|nr:cytochrome b/b6 domain-containing protein [Colwellia sp.]